MRKQRDRVMSKRIEWKSWVEGPRWMGFEDVLKRICFQKGLEVQTLRTTSFLRERVDFKVTGDPLLVEALKRVIYKLLKDAA